jgi:short-subunit dehydrogenase
MSETWIILGATSSMARAFAQSVARRGDAVLLAGRDMGDMETTAADCIARGALSAQAIEFDARKPETFSAIIKSAKANEGQISAAVFVGSMPEQAAIDADPSLIDGTILDCYAGPARFLQM